MLDKYYFEKYYLEVVKKYFTLKLLIGFVGLILFSFADIYIQNDILVFYYRLIPFSILIIVAVLHIIRLKNKWILYHFYNFFLVNLVIMMYFISYHNIDQPNFSSSIVGSILVVLIFSYELRTELMYAFLVYFIPFSIFMYFLIYHPSFDENRIILLSNMFPMLLLGFILNYLHSKARYRDFLNEMQLAHEKSKVDELLATTKIQNEELSAQNEKIIEQKEFLEDQRLEIFESIEYARRIQATYLPEERFLLQLFPRHFVINKPKDIVSGDFYWVARTAEADYLAVIDCTGHGVPGAFLTFVASNFFQKAIFEHQFFETDQILNFLNKEIFRTFRRNEKFSLKVGMDLIVCKFSKDRTLLNFSGAYHSLVHFRGGSPELYRTDLIEIGAADADIVFNEKQIKLQSGDMIYLFTDGYADQMGGDRDRRFMLRRLKDVFKQIHHLSCSEQKETLVKAYEDWRGYMWQTDDILIMGIRI